MTAATKWNRAKELDAQAQRLFAATKPANAVPSSTLTNATTSGIYRGNSMGSARADADQHFQFTSAPMAAQIVRV